MEKIKVGQIGIGHNHAAALMAALRKRPDLFEVIGVCEDDPAAEKERGDHPAYAGLKRLSENELLSRADAVFVETGVPDLTKTALRCAKAGKHIHMDKPGSGSLEEFKELLDTCGQKNLVFQMGYMYRYNPGVMKALEKAKNGDLGKITMINAEMSTCHPVEYKQWLSSFRGGIFYILGSHLVDLCVLLMGKPEKITAFLKHTKTDGIDFADNDLAILEWGSTLGRIFVSSVEQNGWGRRQLVVSGTKGCIDIKPIENVTHVTLAHPGVSKHPYEDEKEVLPIRDIPKDCRYDTMVSDFYDYVCGKKENPFTLAHEFTVQQVLEEICRSDEKGE